MALVRDILARKGQEVHSVGIDAMVLDALQMMADKDVGSVLVLGENGGLAGIFTERLYSREVFLKGRASPKTPVQDVMRREVICVGPEDSAEACMALMADNRIRHLPVESGGRLEGVISIGDLMQSIIDDREFDLDQMLSYIRG